MTEHRDVGARAVRALSLIVVGSVGLVLSCAPPAPASPTAPPAGGTVQAAASTAVVVGGTATAQTQATSVTAARQATATALAPTAQSVATRVAPTVQARATQVVSEVGTSVAVSPLHVINVTVSSDDAIVVIQNDGSASMNLAGWTLMMGPDFSIVLGDINVNAGQTRALHFSLGTDTASDVFIGFGSNAARLSLQPGTRVVLIAPPDQIASIYSIT